MARTPEGEIVNAVCEYLALKKRFFYRNNNTPIFDRGKGIFRAMPKYSRHGAPDIIVVKDGKYIGIEVKTDSGKLSEHQLTFGRELMAAGGEFVVARSIDDVVRAGL